MDTVPRADGQVTDDGCVMASIDRRADGDYLVIADISCDGRWLAVPEGDGLVLTDHQ